MKILILTVTAGAGHNTVAKSLGLELERAGQEVLIVDMFKDNKLINWKLITFGLPTMSKLPRFSDMFFDYYTKTDKNFFPQYVKKIKDSLLETTNEFKPDVIVSTHIAGREFLKLYENMIKKPYTSYFILTDYDIPPGTNNLKKNEYIVTAHDVFTQKLIDKGFDKDKLLTFGIPIFDKFYKKISKTEAEEKLGLNLDKDKLTILLANGGAGVGKMMSNLKRLSKFEDFQIITIEGKNKKLTKRITQFAKRAKIKIISCGWTDKIEYYMALSDIIIGKTGGLTSTEAIAMQLPMVVINRIHKVEYCNLLYFEKLGMATYIRNNRDIYSSIVNIDRQKIKDLYKSYLKPNSAFNLAKHIINLNNNN